MYRSNINPNQSDLFLDAPTRNSGYATGRFSMLSNEFNQGDENSAKNGLIRRSSFNTFGGVGARPRINPRPSLNVFNKNPTNGQAEPFKFNNQGENRIPRNSFSRVQQANDSLMEEDEDAPYRDPPMLFNEKPDFLFGPVKARRPPALGSRKIMATDNECDVPTKRSLHHTNSELYNDSNQNNSFGNTSNRFMGESDSKRGPPRVTLKDTLPGLLVSNKSPNSSLVLPKTEALLRDIESNYWIKVFGTPASRLDELYGELRQVGEIQKKVSCDEDNYIFVRYFSLPSANRCSQRGRINIDKHTTVGIEPVTDIYFLNQPEYKTTVFDQFDGIQPVNGNVSSRDSLGFKGKRPIRNLAVQRNFADERRGSNHKEDGIINKFWSYVSR
uniref:RRM Nup35-type domain-containing protein n=1 Tax=Rhabditophanes sp. KR3021 TaxID=114890 RepID=A0AC35U4Z4_9BILA